MYKFSRTVSIKEEYTQSVKAETQRQNNTGQTTTNEEEVKKTKK
jgi:hypothetical protein